MGGEKGTFADRALLAWSNIAILLTVECVAEAGCIC